MLVGRKRVELELLAPFNQRQLALGLFIILRLLVAPLLIDFEEAVELLHRTCGAENESPGFNVNCRLVEDGRSHLRSDEALPDETIELQLLFVEITSERVRRAGDIRRANRFVRVLRVL